MTKAETLLALAERCEAASGPDRYLDARIWCEVGNHLGFDDPPQKHRLMRPLQPRICIMGRWLGSALDKYPEDVEGVAYNWRVPAFSASLDAAMTLRPKGWVLSSVAEHGAKRAGACWTIPGKYDCGTMAATPALALTAAALRARASLASQDQEK
jgi:hypothetical protein